MIARWPWGNYWTEPDEDAFIGDPIEVTVECVDPEPQHLVGPDGEPITTSEPFPIGFRSARPLSEENQT